MEETERKKKTMGERRDKEKGRKGEKEEGRKKGKEGKGGEERQTEMECRLK